MKKNLEFNIDKLVEIVKFWKSHGFTDDDIYGKNRTYEMSYSGLKTIRFTKEDEIVHIMDNQLQLEKCSEDTIQLIPVFLKILDFETSEVNIREFNDIETDKIKEIIVMHREQIEDKFYQLQIVKDSTTVNQAYLYVNKNMIDLLSDIITFERFKHENKDFIKRLDIPEMVVPVEDVPKL